MHGIDDNELFSIGTAVNSNDDFDCDTTSNWVLQYTSWQDGEAPLVETRSVARSSVPTLEPKSVPSAATGVSCA